jgi:protease-4
MMPDVTNSNHALLTMIGRCLSGQYFIDAQWLYQHADLLLRADQGENMENVWPKMNASLQMGADGSFKSASGQDTIGKGQALGVISITGPIYKYGWSSTKFLIAGLKMMASDDRVGGVKLIVDSPGGMVHGTREVYETVLNFPKPVLTIVDGYMASAAYYLSAGSSKIVATQPNDQIGSIGTYQTIVDWNSFYESMGLSLYDIYAKASSEKNEEYRQAIESKGEKTDLAQKQLTAYNDLFLSDVKAGRGKKLTGKGQDPMKGRLFFTSDALENGLIDEVVSESETLSMLADMVATNKQTSIQMSFLDDVKNLLNKHDSKGTPDPAEPTVDQLTAQVDTLTTERDSAQGQVATLTTERDSLKTQVSTLTTERDGLQQKVDAYGEQPGAMGTKVQKDKDETPNTEGTSQSWEEVRKLLPSEQEAIDMGYE